jgi:cytochrome c oxidase subunit II
LTSWIRTLGKPAARLPALSASLVAAGCSGIQSVHAPAGPHAEAVGWLGWAMYIGGTVILLIVLAALAYAWFARSSEENARRVGMRLILGGGVLLPVLTLTPLLFAAYWINPHLNPPVDRDALRVEVIGHMWWWEVHYREGEDGAPITSANEIRIPTGRPVEFVLKASDVIHSFWVPNLAGKMDMIPGRTNRLRFQVDQPGIYRGQCAEFCGLQHALMAFMVIALEPDQFDAWLERERQPAAEPSTPFLAHGRDAFVGAGCGSCHVIRGVTDLPGRIGPDLTHVGSRQTLAAGTLPNGVGPLAAWIAESQGIKPGNGMPSFNQFGGETLRAIAAYLESLQ